MNSREQLAPDLLFLAGLDWEQLCPEERDRPPAPIINLLAHVRHGSPRNPRQAYLRHRAIRICVSQPVADAVSLRRPNGPVVVIPNALDEAELPEPDVSDRRDTDLLIAGLKQPRLAHRLARRLTLPGRKVVVLDTLLPRRQFLDHLCRARVTLFLPNHREGFYLPALEGMALRTLVVCPDCIGNRDFCRGEMNCLRPDYDPEALIDASNRALGMSHAERRGMIEAGRRTAAEHSLDRERGRFLEILASADELWAA